MKFTQPAIFYLRFGASRRPLLTESKSAIEHERQERLKKAELNIGQIPTLKNSATLFSGTKPAEKKATNHWANRCGALQAMRTV